MVAMSAEDNGVVGAAFDQNFVQVITASSCPCILWIISFDLVSAASLCA